MESALRNIKILEDEDFYNLKISVKSSDVFLSIEAYRQLSKVTDYPLHLGITEAGGFIPGSIKSSIGLGTLLLEGIGDTIRISLSDDPVKEVKIGNEILKSLNLRNRGVKIISCPSCARQGFEVIETVKILEKKLSHIKTPITLSIIGCVVNGPGEAAQTEIGLTGGGQDNNLLYLSGIPHKKVPSGDIIEKVIKLVEDKKIKKVVMCSGKIYFDLLQAREKNKNKNVFIIRIEQLYPFPVKTLAKELKRFCKKAEFFWCQEEPKNMGAWNTVRNYIQWSLNYIKAANKEVNYIGRNPAASPASGYLKKHLAEQNEILEKVIGKF